MKLYFWEQIEDLVAITHGEGVGPDCFCGLGLTLIEINGLRVFTSPIVKWEVFDAPVGEDLFWVEEGTHVCVKGLPRARWWGCAINAKLLLSTQRFLLTEGCLVSAEVI